MVIFYNEKNGTTKGKCSFCDKGIDIIPVWSIIFAHGVCVFVCVCSEVSG